MSLLFSSVVIQTTHITLEASRRVMELQEGGGCFQHGEKALGVKHQEDSVQPGGEEGSAPLQIRPKNDE